MTLETSRTVGGGDHTAAVLAEPVGRARGDADGGHVECDGLAQPCAARPAARPPGRLRRHRAPFNMHGPYTQTRNYPATAVHGCTSSPPDPPDSREGDRERSLLTAVCSTQICVPTVTTYVGRCKGAAVTSGQHAAIEERQQPDTIHQATNRSTDDTLVLYTYVR